MSLSTKVLFFCFSSLLLLPCQKTLVFRFFSINSQVILKNSRPLASNFSILLSNLLKKISIQEFYDTETTTARRKQKIRLWSTGNSYVYSPPARRQCHSLLEQEEEISMSARLPPRNGPISCSQLTF